MFARNQYGSVLVVVMVAMAALLILGGTLSTVALSDQRQAIRQQKNNEAYYIARSGAEAVAHVLENSADPTGYVGDTTESDLGSGRFEVKVTGGDEGEIILHSTGYVGVFSERVTLTLVPQYAPGSPDPPEGADTFLPVFDMAVFSNSSIELTGSAKIFGNCGVNATAPGSINIDWGCSVENLYIGPGGDPEKVVVTPQNSSQTHYQNIGQLEEERQYPIPVFPEFPDDLISRGNLSTQKAPATISQDGSYGKIDIKRPLKIDVGSGVRKIRVNELSLQGSGSIPPNNESSTILIEGTGILKLYIDEEIKIIGGSSSINYKGDIRQLQIYYRGNKDVTIAGAAQVYGCLFSESQEACFNLKGSGGINGVAFLKSENINIEGGSGAVVSVLYAPNAHVKLDGSGSLTGAIVCSSYYAQGGGAHVTYKAEVNEIWDEVPDFDFATELGDDPGPGPDPGDGNSLGVVDGYTRVWSD